MKIVLGCLAALLVIGCNVDESNQCWTPQQTGGGVGGGPVIQPPSGGFGDSPAPKPQGAGGSSEQDAGRCEWGCLCVGLYGSIAHPLPPDGDGSGSEFDIYHCAYTESRSYTRCSDLDQMLRDSCIREHMTARPHPTWTYGTIAATPQNPCKEWFRR